MSDESPAHDLRGFSVFGVDLDLTMLDTRKATASALEIVNATCGAQIDVDAFVAMLGPPIRGELARWMPPEQVEEAVEVFRAAFVAVGIPEVRLMPGAATFVSRSRQRGGALVVITSRIQPIAEQLVASTGLGPCVVVGGLTGVEKASAMAQHSVHAYVGDHVLDMAGALAAGVPGIGVTTGAHDASELRAAGAAVTVADLLELNHVLDHRPRA